MLKSARTLVNVGAGSGSYEPGHMSVVAVEPSQVMIRQRQKGSAPVVCAFAEQLPFPDGMFDVLGAANVSALPVPADCKDGVFGAYWRRPEAYLSNSIRSAISGIALTNPGVVEKAMKRLQADLASGTWKTRNYELLELDELDLGYRIVSVTS